MIRLPITLGVLAALLAGCAVKPVAVAVVPPAPAPEPVAPRMPAGGVAGMAIPVALPDGGYPTPNRGLSGDAALWHLRSVLNVAALACRGPEGDALVNGYNALLTARKSAFAAAQTRYAASWKAMSATDWQDRYDDAMTRVYNFYGQSFARPGFCAAATETLGAMAGVADAALPAFATERLPALDRPFVEFFAAYQAWRTGVPPVAQPPAQAPAQPLAEPMKMATVQPGIVPVSVPTAAPRPAPATRVAAVAPPVPVRPSAGRPVIAVAATGAVLAAKPRLSVDPDVFQLP